jgi:hypothetical protein
MSFDSAGIVSRIASGEKIPRIPNGRCTIKSSRDFLKTAVGGRTEKRRYGAKPSEWKTVMERSFELTAPEAGTFPLVDHHHRSYMPTDLVMPFAVG